MGSPTHFARSDGLVPYNGFGARVWMAHRFWYVGPLGKWRLADRA